MKQETVERLKLSFAELVRVVLASDWFWQRQPPARASTRRERKKLQRAARKAAGGPAAFVSHYLGPDWFKPEPRLPERATAALCLLFDRVALAVHPERLAQVSADRDVLDQLLTFLRALRARPGRRGIAKYDRATELLLTGKTVHQICCQLEPDYAECGRPEQRRCRERYAVAITRRLENMVSQNSTKSPS